MDAVRLSLAALMVLAAVGAHAQAPVPPKPSAQAPAPGGARIKEQLSVQEGIYQSRGEDTPDGYVINRSLLAYNFILGEEFGRLLAELTPADRWLDIGAGQALAVLDYYTPRYDSMNPWRRERRGTKAKSVAMSIEDRRTPLWNQTAAGLEPGKIQYLAGKRLREYSMEELGRFQLVTDVIGGFSYANDLSLFMEQVLKFMDVNGNFFTLLQDVRAADGSNTPHYPGSPYLTELLNADGTELRVCSWLKSISCVKVDCELKTTWKPAVEVYRVQKVCAETAVPVLSSVHYEAGTPPERRYIQRKSTAGPAARVDPVK